MAFKMNPKSPALMKAMGAASPAKQRSGGISSEENRGIKGISEEMKPAQERGMKKEVRLIKKKKASTTNTEAAKKETAKEAEKKVLTPKEKALKALKDAQGDNEVSNIEKETAKVKKNSTKKRKQAKRKDSQAERRTEKTKRLEERIERRKARRSPAKQANRDEVSKFEKNVKIAEKFDAKIEKAKGNTKKIARLTKRANRKMDRSAN